MKKYSRVALTLLLIRLLAACQHAPLHDPELSAAPEQTLSQAALADHHLLFGEVHDHAEGHRWRLNRIESLLQQGARPALVFEMFDRAQQEALDKALLAERQQPRPRAEGVLRRLGIDPQASKGWHWPYYLPLLQLALDHDLPVLAGNLSRAQAGALLALTDPSPWQTLQTWYGKPLPRSVRPEMLEKHAKVIRHAHCDLVELDQARRMAVAQMARDALLAQTLIAAGRPSILIAGSGHTRRDLGVANWLPPELPRLSIGLLEIGYSSPLPPTYNLVHWLEPIKRHDPCQALHFQGNKRSSE